MRGGKTSLRKKPASPYALKQATCSDSICSPVQTALVHSFASNFLPEVKPRYAGYVAWRGVVPESYSRPSNQTKESEAPPAEYSLVGKPSLPFATRLYNAIPESVITLNVSKALRCSSGAPIICTRCRSQSLQVWSRAQRWRRRQIGRRAP